jgi:osmoprotectant transport system ATP-binding protein
MSEFPAVELRAVSKIFAGGVKAVDRVTLDVTGGSIVALLGPSGCGKTTTLRLINRLEEPSAGEVLVRGQDVRSQRPEELRRSIGYVIQEGGLFPHLDVGANVATVPRLLGWTRARLHRRVAEILELVGLPEPKFGRRLPAQLSGGQRQRVGVARALAADPDLLLMDEPFGALDPGTRAAIHDEFLRLHARLRKTVVLVTHDLLEAGRLADEIVLLDGGSLVQRGTLRDLLLRPADARVRTFLGSRGTELALGMLHVGQAIVNLPAESHGTPSRRLSATLSLGRALAALEGTGDKDLVAVEGDPGGMYLAKNLRERIVADLKGPACLPMSSPI